MYAYLSSQIYTRRKRLIARCVMNQSVYSSNYLESQSMQCNIAMDILETDISWTFNLKMLPFKQALIVAKMSTCLQKLLPELTKKHCS